MNPDNDPIIIVDYDPMWPVLFEAERKLLVETLGDTIADIQHIGSTAVPNLAAKPVIDIQIAVKKLASPDEYLAKISPIGYKHKSDDINWDHLFFCKGDNENPHTHHLHIVEKDSDEQQRHIVFRDYLRKNPRGAQEYEALKRAMAEKFANDRSAYVDAKTAFITLALSMYGSSKKP